MLRETDSRHQGLAEDSLWFRALAEATSAAIFIYQGARLLYVNPAAEKVTGFSREELLAMDVWDVAHPDFRARAKEIVLARQRREPVPPRYELPILTKGGEQRWLDLSAAIITFQGKPAVVGAGFDITARRLAGEALSASDQRYRNIVDTANEGIWMLDGAGRIEFLNRRISEMFGYEQDQMLGRPVSDFMEPEMREQAAWHLERCHAGDIQRFDFPFRRADGSCLWALVSCTPVPNGQGVYDRALAMLVDVTDRRIAENTVRSRERLLGTLLTRLHSVREEERARIAREIHDELGQALTVLRMEVSRLKAAGDVPDAGSRVDGMLTLLDKTMDTVRKLATELRPVVLDTFGLKAAVKWQAKEFSRRTGIECAVEALSVDGSLDPTRSTAVFRILQEALTNVTRHAEAAHVRVWLAVERGEAELVVEDDGVGIAPRKVSEGTSLGLLGMRERALSFGGVVTIGPRPEGGTRVELRLPRLEPEEGR